MFYSIILFWVMFCYVLQYTTYTYTYTYTYIHAGICMLADEYIYIHMYMHACMHTNHPDICMYARNTEIDSDMCHLHPLDA